MRSKSLERTNLFALKLTPQEYALFRRRAAKLKMPMSEYVRYSAMLEACYAPDREAYKILAKGFSQVVRDWFEQKFGEKLKET
jgi:hypothetical protein